MKIKINLLKSDKMLNFAKKIIKGGWKNFKRQGFLSFATALIIFVVVLLGTSLFIFEGGVRFFSEKIRDKIDVSVYFKESVDREAILDFKSQIEKMPEVKSVEYISPEDAYAIFSKSHENDDFSRSLQAIQVNPFLASLKIKTNFPEQYATVTEFFKKEEVAPYVRNVNDHKRGLIIEKFSKIATNVENVGLIATIILSIIAIIITYNTVRLSIHSQRMEIEVMHLVGAKNSLVRGPFLVQGMLSGFFASLVAFIISLIIIFSLKDKVLSITDGFDISAIYMTNLSLVILLQFGLGIGLGLVSSYIATKKYLKD
ncbi:MAG: permease-like cell division protein FtsX [Candidatus Pacebacteria bacterium]|nr:permease-like cell division protein FtsX [Candidatus Paceibacterota bacterium]